MQHKLLTLVCIIFCSLVAVHGSQIRLMNARFYSAQIVSVTTDLFTFNNLSMSVQGRYPTYEVNNIPVSQYVELPNSLFGLYQNLSFFAYDVDIMEMPVTPMAEANYFLVNNQLYTLVFVARSEDFGEPPTDVPSSLFIFEELAPSAGPFIKIVNVAVASYPDGYLWVTTDNFGDFYIPYGGDTGFFGLAVGSLNITAYFPGFDAKNFYVELHNLTTVIYLRGDVGNFADFSYEIAENNWFDFNVVEPVAPPVIIAPVASPVSPPWPTVNWIKIRFLNALDPYGDTYTLAIYRNASNSINITTALMSEYQYIYGPTGQYTANVIDSSTELYSSTPLWLESGKSYTIVNYRSPYVLQVSDDLPSWFTNRTSSFMRLANFGPDEADIVLNLDYWGTAHWFMTHGSIYNYVESFGGFGNVNAVATNYSSSVNFYMPSGTATSVFLLSYNDTSMFFYVDTQPLPGQAQVCVNGYVESNGVCNCYSGYTNDNSPYQCSYAAPYYCFNNQNDSLSNDFVPWIPYWDTQVYGNQLYFSVQSQIVTGRRTIIEMPNPQCSFINRPQYYQKSYNGCYDRINVQVPFTECGFTKTSTASEDVYKGTVIVKQIDHVIVAGTTYDRVIETPMPISIRMPKNLAIQSYVQVYGPPSLAIEAAFVGQTVSTESQSGNLQYVSAVQYPLAIDAVELVDLPYGVTAWIEVINVNCTSFGPCVQRLEVHVNTTSCSISGVYRMVVSLSCRSEQGCPEEAQNGTQVYIESRIAAQSLCGEVSIDIELNGYLQAYADETFSSPALAFYPGQSAYFLVNAFSPRVSLSQVSLVSIYYYGPNVNYQYLYYDTNVTDVAIANNFTTGSIGSAQAFFGLDISVSTPGSGDDSLFKLYQGQNGVYNFVVIVDVEWFVASAPLPAVAPVAPNTPFAFKKRMALQGSVSNQGSQFTAQVQIAGSEQQTPQQQQPPVTANPDSDPVSASISLSSSLFVVIVMAILVLF